MKTNKLENSIKEKFAKRTIEPSVSAWERLSAQLDEQPQKKKKGWFFYIGAAASILLLISIGFYLFSDGLEEITPNEEIVITPIDKKVIEKKIDTFINEIPVEEALVKVDKLEEKQIVKKKVNLVEGTTFYSKKKRSLITVSEVNKQEKLSIAQVDEKEKNINSKPVEKSKVELNKNTLQQNPNSRIKINSDDLLYAVTHSPKEVKTYYAKYNVNREDVLRTIKSELKKSNLKVNPNTILAEVERTIDDDYFENNFMKSLKKRVSDIATAIASRND
jgi:hypothetical protein